MKGRSLSEALFGLRVFTPLAKRRSLRDPPAPEYFRGDVGRWFRFQKFNRPGELPLTIAGLRG